MRVNVPRRAFSKMAFYVGLFLMHLTFAPWNAAFAQG